MIEWKETLLSQYANSPTIVGLIHSFHDCMDTTQNINEFFKLLWDIDTAGECGLDFWGKVVDIPRQLKTITDSRYFGFEEAYRDATSETGVQPFGQAPFYNGSELSGVYTLQREAYRRLIMVKAMSNITDSTALTVNRTLQYIWGNTGRCYVIDYGDMAIRYVFEFTPSLVDISIITNSNAIARPAGVKLDALLVIRRPEGMSLSESGIYPYDAQKFSDNGGSIYEIQ